MQHLGNGFTFNAERHEYRLGHQVVPATTGVLSGSGLVPYRFVEYDILERKGELGKAAHLACHLHNLAKLGDLDDRVKPYLAAWIYFKQHAIVEIAKLREVVQVAGEMRGLA